MKNTRQVAALPVRIDKAGALQVLLVTSRETRRWVIPKGWPWPDRADHLAAAEEAREEAGVRGKARKVAIGSYDYDKRLKSGAKPVRVDIYLLVVTRELDKWPERDERTRAWFAPESAAKVVGEPELRELLHNLPVVLGSLFDKIRKVKAAKSKSKTRKAKAAKAAKASKSKDRKKGSEIVGELKSRNPG